MDKIALKHPEWLYIDVNGKTSHGYDQEWFSDEWQRLSGCGPTTATQVMSYAAFRDGILDVAIAHDQTGALERMNVMWNYVKPRFGGGVYKTQWMEAGLQKLMKEKELPYEVHMINVSPFAASRVETDVAVDFIKTGLSQDVPIAFLNRHKGKEPALYTWHWVPIVGIFTKGDDVRCEIFDEGDIRDFFLTNWLKDTILGGGFAYVSLEGQL